VAGKVFKFYLEVADPHGAGTKRVIKFFHHSKNHFHIHNYTAFCLPDVVLVGVDKNLCIVFSKKQL
jgi:hypothetical protein